MTRPRTAGAFGSVLAASSNTVHGTVMVTTVPRGVHTTYVFGSDADS
jgi:hypothetical protein